MVKQRKQADVIQRYQPNWSSRFKFRFRNKTQGHFESALYCMGHGDKSIFWYWEIDSKLGHYREFRTIDLAKGQKRFREEDFGAWTEWGEDTESDSESEPESESESVGGRRERVEVDNDLPQDVPLPD